MKKILVTLLFTICFLLFITPAQAIIFDLIAPSGQLQRGGEAKFTINIDTENQSFASTKIGMTYDQTVLEYVSTSRGNTFTTISADPQENGKILISGNSSQGFSGSGTYAYVTFNIIAQSPASTEVCALFNPGVTPTSTSPISMTPLPTSPTTLSSPTSLPTSGSFDKTNQGIISGLVFLTLAGVGLILVKKI